MTNPMPDDVMDAAHDYSLHAVTCEVCIMAGPDLCDTGMELLQRFHDALNGMLMKPNFDA